MRTSVDYIIAIRRFIFAVLNNVDTAIPVLLCYIPIFGGFLIFLIWNKGIVLGVF